MSIINTLLGILIIIIMIYAFKNDKSFINPSFLHPIPWILSLFIYLLNIDKLGKISNITLFIIIFGALMFQLGYYTMILVDKKSSKSIDKYKNKKQYIKIKYIDMLIVIEFMLMILMIFKAIKIANSVNVINFFVSLRLGLGSLSDVTGGYGILGYLLSISNSIFAFVLILYVCGYKELKNRAYISFIIAMVVSILQTGRGFLVQLLLIGVTIILINSKSIKSDFKLIIRFIFIFIFIFTVYGFTLKKGISSGNGIANLIEEINDQLVMYLSASIKGFDYWLTNHNNLELGINMFRTPIVILNKLGFDFKVINLVKEFSDTNIPTNVYTIYQPYIADFGILFAFVIQCILGYLNAYLYKTAKKYNYISIFMLAALMYAFITQFFIDSYFSLMSTWMQYWLMGIILFKSNIFIRYEYKINEEP